MTEIRVKPRRPRSYDMFVDLTPLQPTFAQDGEWLVISFAAEIPPETVDAIHARMASRDDEDQAARANLAALTATAEDDPADLSAVRALSVALAHYLLDV